MPPSARSPLSALVVVLVVVLVGAPRRARANTPEDVEGLGARTIAMGDAGTAIAADATALYHSPAGLADCAPGSLLLDLRHTDRQLTVSGGAPAAPVADVTRATVGYCGRGPLGWSFAVLLGSGLERPMVIDQTTLDPTPRFVLHGDLQDQLTILVGAARHLGPRVSLGAGIAVLATSGFVLGAEVPILAAPGDTVEARVSWALDPTFAPYLGAQLRPVPGVRLAVTYRAALFHALAAETSVGAVVVGVPATVNLRMASVSWYSPRSLSVGGAVERGPFTVTGDLTWQGWSAYPGPFVSVAPGDAGLATLLPYPAAEDLGFRDAVIGRVGAEVRLGDAIAVRAGAGYRPAILGAPTGRARLLDNDVIATSLGAGHRWSVAGAGGATGPADAVEVGLDGFVRIRHALARDLAPAGLAAGGMPTRHGGRLVDVGVTLTVAWR